MGFATGMPIVFFVAGRGPHASSVRPTLLVSGAIFAVNKPPAPPPVAEQEDTPLRETYPLPERKGER